MKKFVLSLSSSLLAAALAFPALAGDYGGSGMGMGMGKMRGCPGMAQGECMMNEQGMHGSCPMMGAHSMTGKVDNVDHARGTLTLKHAASDMTLHFPSAAIRDVKNGDTITVRLGFAREVMFE